MGCGLHIDSCLADVLESDRCVGWRTMGWRTTNCDEISLCATTALGDSLSSTVYKVDGLAEAYSSIETDFLRRNIAPDGSCLFNAIIYLMRAEHKKTMTAENLREVVASVVLADPEKYNEAYLGKKTEEYAAWIIDPLEYGGEVEIVILAAYFKVALVVVDCQVNSSSKSIFCVACTFLHLISHILHLAWCGCFIQGIYYVATVSS